MPKDLIYLALIESEFNPNAKSRVKAVGMWQFMKGTAKQYGLAVGGSVDERKNPKLSTDAAITYLSSLHDRLAHGISPPRRTTRAKARCSKP